MGNSFLSCCCCEHNCIIFPAPRPIAGWEFQKQVIHSKKTGDPEIQVQLMKDFFNEVKEGQKVPYIQISNEASRRKRQVVIYFHGNAEDIFHSIDFILPIFKNNEITTLCIEYPTYSCYETPKSHFISDRIKTDSLLFHKHIQTQYHTKPQQIYIIGRSIGSGPASYLASQVYCPKLVLISPFDSIRKVSMGLVGCIGFVIKNHFSNEESILTHQGDLLVIHGRIDEVIKFSHGQTLVEVFQKKSGREATFIQPARMSHNGFDMQTDIVAPITRFLTGKDVLLK